jgi:hypothetical protein
MDTKKQVVKLFLILVVVTAVILIVAYNSKEDTTDALGNPADIRAYPCAPGARTLPG